MWIIVALLIVIYTLATKETTEVKVGNFETRNFFMSGGKSKENFTIMKNGGVGEQSLRQYAQMEDRFLALEQETVCRKRSRLIEATNLSTLIKERFPGYDFTYHGKHLKQMAEPDKVINANVRC